MFVLDATPCEKHRLIIVPELSRSVEDVSSIGIPSRLPIDISKSEQREKVCALGMVFNSSLKEPFCLGKPVSID
ncbi:hypothetical protein A5683_09940 [Mycobacterium mantenii]|uniref:Uncharacterized protein n=1 Tax=Mycobacterium mantenii TaxID=560555 RepID=A0A1A2SSF7_MYCNT|nr:hypothetical protein A5688_02865 [Mycobacterium mantenii]OBH67056.1 hypothetical protein A5683_09940 [Mycobacterium mantenii]